MKIGYARVSTDEQNLDPQRCALRLAGCEKIFDERISSASTTRPGLDEALAQCSPEEVLGVWKLDRLDRSLSHLVSNVQELGDKGCRFRSLSENIDTTTASGRLVFHLMGSLAEFERALIAERTRAGLAAARMPQFGRLKLYRALEVQLSGMGQAA